MQKLYDGVSFKLITPELKLLMDAKVLLFERKLSLDAPLTEIVGVMTGYELIETTGYHSGYCDYEGQKIALHKTNNRGLINTIFHEMGHALQAEVGIFDKMSKLLSAELHMEQQCESIAFYLQHKCLKRNAIEAKEFDSYFNDWDIEYLREYYKGWVDDDLPTKPFLHSARSRY
jgi:Zn-dependent peptidase ImmA (M78 family)